MHGDPTAPEIGRYRPLRWLDAGSQAEVYLARDERLGRLVAVKLLRAGCDGRAVSRLRREARVLAELHHDAVCQVFDVGDADGRPFLVLEYVEGETFATLLERARAARDSDPGSDSARARARVPSRPLFPPTELCRAFARLAHGLAAAHERGIVHRDIKPANLMREPTGRVVILDFGLASAGDDGLITQTGDVLGTPAYQAPEQIEGHPDVDGRADVFALGACLYECLTLDRAFAGPTRARVHEAILLGEPPSLRPREIGCSLDLMAVLGHALAKDPGDRYPTASALAADLEAVTAGQPVAARRPTLWAALVRHAHRRPVQTLGAVALTAGLITVAVLGGFWLESRKDVARWEREHRARTLEVWMEDAYLELGEGSAARAAAGFDRVLAVEISSLALAGRVLAALEGGDLDRTARLIDDLPATEAERPGFVALRRDVFAARGEHGPVLPLPSARTSTDPIDHFLLGMRELRAGHAGEDAAFDRAVGHFERCLLFSVSSLPLAHMELAHAAAHTSDARVAEDAANVLLLRWPNRPTACFRAGLALMNVDPSRALAALREAHSLAPSSHVITLNMSVALLRMGHPEAARDALEPLGNDEDADARVHLNLAGARRILGDDDGALAALRTAIATNPDLGEARHELGVLLEARGLPDEAREQYRLAAESQRDPVNALIHRSRWHLLQGNPQAAWAALQQAERLAPRREVVLAALAEATMAGGAPDRAADYAKRQIAVAPMSERAWSNLADAEFVLGRRGEAARAARRALELVARDPLSYLKFGAILAGSGLWDEAVAVYAEGLALIETPELLCNYGLALAELGRHAQAVASLDRGHRLGILRPGWGFPSDRWHADAAAERQRLVSRLAEMTPTTEVAASGAVLQIVACAESENQVTFAADFFAAWYDDGAQEPPRGLAIAAARAAARAAATEGSDSADLAPERRAEMARRAVTWLALEFERLRASPSPGLPWLFSSWTTDAGFAAIRDEDRTRELPPEVAARARTLWESVAKHALPR